VVWCIRQPNAEEEKRKALCLEQLARDRQELLIKYPFIGSVLMRMELVPVRDDRLETACTDGNTIYVDVDFYSRLPRLERLFVLAHEIWHTILLHFARKQNRDAKLFNIAADLEIHFTLQDEKFKEPWVLPHDLSWSNLSAEEIYEKLLLDPRYDKSGKEADQPVSGSGKYNSSSFDRHIYENSSQVKSAEEILSENSDANCGDFVMDSDYAPQVKSNTAERIRGRVVAAAQQIERMQGTLPGKIQKILNDLLKPSLPWQELLKQFVTICYGGERHWLPPARRHIWNGLYLPSMRDKRINAVVAVDTSGSTICNLESFFAELVGIMKSFGGYDLTVIQCDAAIQKIEHFTEINPLSKQNIEVKGMGGTDFRPVFDYVKKSAARPDLLIYLTDGWGTAPDESPAYPVMWVLTANGNVPAAWGKSLFLKNSQTI
jgi:predicted metal-dependent peptidase